MATIPSTRTVREPEDLLAVVARRDDRHRQLSFVQFANEGDRPGIGFHLAGGDRLLDQFVLAIAETADALDGRIVGGVAIRQLDIPRLEKAAHAFVTRLAVDVRPVVALD